MADRTDIKTFCEALTARSATRAQARDRVVEPKKKKHVKKAGRPSMTSQVGCTCKNCLKRRNVPFAV